MNVKCYSGDVYVSFELLFEQIDQLEVKIWPVVLTKATSDKNFVWDCKFVTLQQPSFVSKAIGRIKQQLSSTALDSEIVKRTDLWKIAMYIFCISYDILYEKCHFNKALWEKSDPSSAIVRPSYAPVSFLEH